MTQAAHDADRSQRRHPSFPAARGPCARRLCFPVDFLATAKNQHTEIGREYWVAALPAHALIHGALVFAVTGSSVLGVAEAVAHGAIDWCKNEGWFGFRVDRGLHALCKVLWLVLFLHGGICFGQISAVGLRH